MKRKHTLVVILLLLCAFALMFQLSGLAEAGNFAGDSDFGGGDFGGGDWDSDWDSDWGFSGSGSGGSIMLEQDASFYIRWEEVSERNQDECQDSNQIGKGLFYHLES